MTIFSRFLMASCVLNACILILDDIPVDVTWKEFVFKRFDQNILKVLYDIQMRGVFPASALCVLLSANKLRQQIFGSEVASKDVSNTILSSLSTSPGVSSLSSSLLASNSAFATGATVASGIISTAYDKTINRPFFVRVLKSIAMIIKKYISLPFSLLFNNPIVNTLSTLVGRALKLIVQNIITTNPKAQLIRGLAAMAMSWLSVKFLWRIRNNMTAYFNTDNSAYMRDALEFSFPSRWWFSPLMYLYELIFNPVVIGIERIAPYASYQSTAPTASDGDRIIGLTMLTGDFTHYGDSGNSGGGGCEVPITPNYTAKLYKQPSDARICNGMKPRALLFVGNHVLLGVDMVMLQWCVTKWMQVFMRGLAHRGHFNIPGWSHLMRWIGAVPGSREVSGELMDRGWSLLVYPGGGREVMKKADDDPYTLMWGHRYGFTKLAIQHKAVIIPVASVGVNETLPILCDMSFEGMYGRYSDVEDTVPLSDEEAHRVQCKLDEIKETQLSKYYGWTEDAAKEWGVKAKEDRTLDNQKLTQVSHTIVTDINLQHTLNILSPVLHKNKGNANTLPTPLPQLNSGKPDSTRASCISPYSEEQLSPEFNAIHVNKDNISIIISNVNEQNNTNNTTTTDISVDTNNNPEHFSLSHESKLNNTNKTTTTSHNNYNNDLKHNEVKPKVKGISATRNPLCSKDLRVTSPIALPPSPLNWQRWYFEFCPPIDGLDYEGLEDSETACMHLRDRVKKELEEGVTRVRKYQSNDPSRYTLTRWGKYLSSWFTSSNSKPKSSSQHDKSTKQNHLQVPIVSTTHWKEASIVQEEEKFCQFKK